MTIEEAIDHIKNVSKIGINNGYTSDIVDAYAMVVKTLDKEQIMTDREMKSISTILRNHIYRYVNENYKDNLDVMNFTLEINEEHMDAWVKDILSHDILWRDPERLQHERHKKF